MPGKNLILKIRLTGDGSDLKAEVIGAESRFKKFGQQAEQSGVRAEKAFSRTRKGVESISKQLSRMQGIAAAAFTFAGISSGVRKLVHMSDTYTSLNAQLATASSNSIELSIAQTALQRIARETRGSWEATVTVYARMARATKELGVPQQDLLTVTKALNQAVTVSGATSIEASNALIQLSQGMASGVLRGDELRSVLEQIPRVGQAIAKGMGISFGQLRQMGTAGKITTEQIITALKKQASVLQSEFNKMPPTVASAAQQVSDSMTQLWGKFTTTSGAATELANSILFLADNLKSIATGALLLAKLGVVAFAGKIALARIAANTLTFSLAGLRSASLDLFMLYKTGGVKSVLAAPFYSMATATKAAFKGVSKLAITSSVLFAAWAGWEIGTYLSDQFAVVRQAGVALVAGLIKGWTYIKAAFELMGSGISIAWGTMIAGLKHQLGNFLSIAGRAIDKLPFMDGVATSVKGYATQLQNAQGPLETFAAAQKRINDERDRTIGQQDKILAAMFVDAGKDPSSAGIKKTSKTAPIIPPIKPPKAAGSKLLSSADSLTRQLSDTYKSSFERISDRYSAMFDKLEAIGKPGEARLAALSAAYDQFAENRWIKQEEARKGILSKGVDAIAQSLLSEDERRKQALDNRLLMLQQAQDDGLISEQRSLELRNQLHADYDQSLADQKLQAMQKVVQAEAAKDAAVGNMQKSAYNQGVEFLQLFAGKSKAISLILIGLQTAKAVIDIQTTAAAAAQVTAYTAVASMNAMAQLGPILGPPAVVGIAAMGAAQLATIGVSAAIESGLAIASGAMKASSVLKGGGDTATPTYSVNPSTGLSSQSPQPTAPQQPAPQPIYIINQGNVMTSEFMDNQVIPYIQDRVGNNDVQLIPAGSRNEQEIIARANSR